MQLKDKVAVITGASSGIGTAVAVDLNQAGMKLVLTGRNAVALAGVASGLSEAVTLAADISEPGIPQKLIVMALERFGRCDVVFNNAGVMQAGPVDIIDMGKIAQMVRINVEAAYVMAYAALKHFRSVGGGHLVNVSSVLGTKVRPTTGAYAGTKYAIEALSESLRMELAQTGVKVSCIEPGIVDTNLCAHFEVHPKEVFNVRNELQPQDIARAVRFVLEQPDHVLIPRIMVLPAEQAL